MTTYKVRFPYYHYNTGMANNGYADGSIQTDCIESAREIKQELNRAVNGTANHSEVNKINEKYLDGDGHITGPARIIEVTEFEVQ